MSFQELPPASTCDQPHEQAGVAEPPGEHMKTCESNTEPSNQPLQCRNLGQWHVDVTGSSTGLYTAVCPVGHRMSLCEGNVLHKECSFCCAPILAGKLFFVLPMSSRSTHMPLLRHEVTCESHSTRNMFSVLRCTFIIYILW